MTQTQDIRQIVVLSNPRTGSNYFADTFWNFRQDVVSLSEIFHKDAVFDLDKYPASFAHLSAALGAELSGQDDPRLVQAARETPVRFLDILAGFSAETGRKALVYKAFQDHFPQPKWRDIFQKTRPTGLFLVRNRLETFISFKKAMMTGHWANMKTDGLRPTLDAGDFRAWAIRQDGWYADMEQLFHDLGLRYAVVDYGRDVTRATPELLRYQYRLLRGMGLDPRFPDGPLKSRFHKQDGTRDILDRIENADAFLQDAAALGLDEDALFAPPLLSPRITG